MEANRAPPAVKKVTAAAARKKRDVQERPPPSEVLEGDAAAKGRLPNMRSWPHGERGTRHQLSVPPPQRTQWKLWQPRTVMCQVWRPTVHMITWTNLRQDKPKSNKPV